MRRVMVRLLIAFAFFSEGCSPKPSDPALIINNGTEPQTLDPGLQEGAPEHRINIALFEGLTVYDPKDLKPKPGIASSWDIGGNETLYTFHLRESKWSNGDPVTAYDFEWSWKRILNPALASEYAKQIYVYLKNGKAYYLGASADATLQGWKDLSSEKKFEFAAALPAQAQKRHAEILRKMLADEKDPRIATPLREALKQALQRDDVMIDQVGVKAKDDRTLVVTLENPTAYFLDLTAFFTYYPVHRKTVENHEANWTKPETFAGNGPYRMKEWKVKDCILVEKNPHYWDAANIPDQKVKFLPIENQTTAFNLYEEKKIHWLTDVPREYIEEIIKRADYKTGPFLATYFYGINTKRGPLTDKRVRKALALAIDREKIVKYITRSGESPALSLVPPLFPGYTPALMPAYDPAAAGKLLAEAGYPDGHGFPKIEILHNTSEAHKKTAAAIQEMWRSNLKIDAGLRNVEWKIYLDMQSRLEFDVIRRGWIGDYSDPNTFTDLFTSDNGLNNTGFANSAYDALVHDAAREREPAKRMKMLHDAEAILMDEMPIIPLYFYITKNMLKPPVSGFHDNIRDTHPLNRVRISGQAP